MYREIPKEEQKVRDWGEIVRDFKDDHVVYVDNSEKIVLACNTGTVVAHTDEIWEGDGLSKLIDFAKKLNNPGHVYLARAIIG